LTTENLTVYNISTYDSDGNLVWERNWSVSNMSGEYAEGVAIDSYDNIIVGGEMFLNDSSIKYGWHIEKLQQVYAYERNFSTMGIYEWNVSCNKTGYDTLNTSDTVTISSPNVPPTQLKPVLNSTFGTNLTTENLTVYNISTYDVDGDRVKNIYNWKRDGDSATILNMPFEGGSTSGTSENNGTTRDYSGYNNNGTVINATWNSTGGYDRFGAYSFDGIDDYINLGNGSLGPKLNRTIAMTLSVWINTRDIPSGSDYKYVFDTQRGSNSGLSMYLSDSLLNVVSHCSDSDGSTQLSLDYTITDVWQHFVAVADFENEEIILYQNGTYLGTLPATCTPGYYDYYGQTKEDFIGVASPGTGSFFNGTIDEVQVYLHAMLAERVKMIYENRTNIVLSEETGFDDTFQACITPNDGYQDGATNCSNNLTILDVRCGDRITRDVNLTQDLTQTGSGTCIIIEGNNITLDCNGYTIRGDDNGYGISTENNNSLIKNCIISNFSSGVYLRSGSMNNNITNTTLFDNDQYGIWVEGSNYNTISNCTFNSSSPSNPDTSRGVFLNGNNYNTIISSIFSDVTDYSIYAQNSNYLKILNSTFLKEGIRIEDISDNVDIINNTITPSAGTGIYSGGINRNNMIISGNFIESNDGYSSINLTDVQDVEIYNNIINRSGFGSADFGIRINEDNARAHIHNNIIRNYGRAAIVIEFGDYSRIENNTIYHGMESASAGIYLWGSNEVSNNLTGNNITNSTYGIRIESSTSDNLIYNNYVANNSINALDASSGANHWNTTYDCSGSKNIISGNCIGGNYWGNNYTGYDLNGDGIGDSHLSYTSGGNINSGGDYLPLSNNQNNLPTQLIPILNSTFGTNYTSENLTVYNISTYDADGHIVKNIINWKKDGIPLMVLNLPFEGGSSSNYTRDYSNYSNDGTVVNAVWNSTGGYDGKGSYYFDGDNDYINLSSVPEAKGSPYYSFAMWLKTRNNTQTQTVLSKDTLFVQLIDNQLKLSGVSDISSTDFMDIDEWTLLTVTYNYTHIATYKNGTLDYVASCGSGICALPNSDDPVLIGEYVLSSWNGSIDEFQVYNITLSSEQIKAIYENRTDLIVSQELSDGDNWSACITPNDGYQDGDTDCSNNVTIFQPNTQPTQLQPVLNSTFGTNLTTENLTVYNISTYDSDGDPVKNIINWYKNGNSTSILNMPFENEFTYPWSLRDYSSYENNATQNSGASWNATGGYDGRGAYEFNDGYLSIAYDDSLLIGGENFSVRAYVKVNDLADAPFPIVGIWGGSDPLRSYLLNIGVDGVQRFLQFYVHDGAGFDRLRYNVTDLVSAGRWYHFAATFNVNTKNATLYMNGSVVNSTLFSRVPQDSSDSVDIGAQNGVGQLMTGTIDEVMVYDSLLSPEQISAIYNNRTDLIVSQQTSGGEVWQACITPNDGYEDGLTNCSNNVTIYKLDCGDTITEDTNLTEDLTNCAGDGLVIGADNITLDCKGYSIMGDLSGVTDYGIDNSAGYDNITVKNCNISKFYDGIHHINSGNHTVVNNTFFNNDHAHVVIGAVANKCDNSLVENNNFKGNYSISDWVTDYGVSVNGGDYHKILGNNFSGHRVNSIFMNGVDNSLADGNFINFSTSGSFYSNEDIHIRGSSLYNNISN
ncbi:LamG-like jellyroll fold domain-containing protein, partial [Nanoarchaeota archaeon]